MKKSEFKYFIKENIKKIVREAKNEETETEEDLNIDTPSGEENIDISSETDSGDVAVEMDNALDAAIKVANSYGDPKLSTLLDNAKIYLARTLARK
jgi:hypothetical protein